MDTSAATTYTDINGLAALKSDPNSPQAISAVAAASRGAVPANDAEEHARRHRRRETDSNEMGMYQDMFDKQVALTISQHDDLGIGALLKRQLTGKTAPGAREIAFGESAGCAAPRRAASRRRRRNSSIA